MKRSYIIPIIVVLIVIVLFAWMRNGDLPGEVPGQEQQGQWMEYRNEDQGFSLQHLQGMEIHFPDESRVNFFIVGPTQGRATEFYDGLSFTVARKQLAGKSLIDHAQEFSSQEQAPHFTLLQGPSLVEVGNNEAYFMEIEGLVGVPFSIYMIESQEEFFEITIMTPDPTAQGYESMGLSMLESFEILD